MTDGREDMASDIRHAAGLAVAAGIEPDTSDDLPPGKTPDCADMREALAIMRGAFGRRSRVLWSIDFEHERARDSVERVCWHVYIKNDADDEDDEVTINRAGRTATEAARAAVDDYRRATA